MPVAIVVTIFVMVRYVFLAVGVAAKLLHLARRHIAIAPACLFALVPSGRAFFVAIAIAVVVAIGVVVAIVIAIVGFVLIFVFVFVLLVAAAVAVSVASLGVGTGRQGHAEDQRQQKLHELGSHWETLLPDRGKSYATLAGSQVTKGNAV